MPPEIKPPTTAEIEEALKDLKNNTDSQMPPAESSFYASVPIKPLDNLEIEQALQEFTEKEIPIQVPQKQISDPNKSKLVDLVIRYSGGAIQERRHAEYIILGFVVIIILFSFYLVFGQGQNEVDMSALENVPVGPPP